MLGEIRCATVVPEKDRLCDILLNFIQRVLLGWIDYSFISVDTGTQFFIVLNKMSAIRTHAKVFMVQDYGTVVKCMGPAAG